jgi:hypothetical protein
MPNSGPTPLVDEANTPTIFNVPVATANTEVSQALPNATRKLTIKARRVPGQPFPTIKFAFISGQSNVDFITIPPGCSYSEDNLDLNNQVLYLQTDQAPVTIEVLSWSRV